MSQPLILIQARKNSRRFPNKINQLIEHKRMIDHVIDRCRKTGLKWMLCRAEDWPEIDEQDVLGRFCTTLQAIDPDETAYDPCIRITADCPLLESWLIRHALALYEQEHPKVLIGTAPGWDGLDVEVIPRQSLTRAYWAAGRDSYEAEHVTPWIKFHERWHEIPLATPIRWSVDDESGLDFVRRVMQACEHCRAAVPHHTNSRVSIGGSDRQPVWDLHQVEDGGLAECAAYDILKERIGGPVYVSG